ncbi:MAG: 23S rRNA (adenine(2503)-C(2))-methyltransferase RlmN [Planctomycetota bacterium]
MKDLHHVLQPESAGLARWLAERDHPAYRARQIQQWLFKHRVAEFSEMANLPARLRAQLAETFRVWTFRCEAVDRAADGTEKLLLKDAAGGRVECVLLRDRQRRSICISSQIGCAMQCAFCASGLLGVERNLSAGEMIEQMLHLQRRLPTEERLSHIVVMGMGEPLVNLEQVLLALDQASDENGLGISARRITISTIGIPAAMRRLARHDRHYHLAVSLHAPNDELRNQLVPANRKTGLRELLRAADAYFEGSGRRLTYEYILLADVNDRLEHARQLVQLLAGRTALLNLIPYNPVAGLPYRTSTHTAIGRFRDCLRQGGVNVHVREKKGDSINAACGQLRRAECQSAFR